MIAGLVQWGGGIKPGNFGNGGHHIGGATEVQRDARGSANGVLGVIEIGVHHTLGDVVIDRSGETAGERVSRTVRDAADIQRPETDADDERMTRRGGFGQRERDRSAGRRLLIERGPLDHANGLRASCSRIKSSNERKEREEQRSDAGTYMCVV